MTHLARPALGLLLLVFTLLLPIAPAAAVQITDVHLNCAGTRLAPGVTLTNTDCGGGGLWRVQKRLG
jgi:hypothetical protein